MTDGTQPPISDYGIISDMHSCALVSRAGSIDWCCFPRFDSPSVFGRLIDWEDGGCFSIATRGAARGSTRVTRRYVPGTNVLETTFETGGGTAVLTDFMPVQGRVRIMPAREATSMQQIIRRLTCTRGSIDYELVCRPRFDYGTVVPHVELHNDHVGFAHGGGQSLSIFASGPLELDEDGFGASATLREGEEMWSAVTHQVGFGHSAVPLHERMLQDRLRETQRYWEAWSGICTYEGPYGDMVQRSALTLKALTYAPSGALLAAATTSLPEDIGGERNWDYRFTWIRDATLALYALFILGYREEAMDFKDWVEWSTLGRAADLQPMYGIGGERRLTEITLDKLAGYRDSRPVRIGNGAYTQYQLDIYGELLDSAHQYRRFGGEVNAPYWEYLRRVVRFACDHWREPDEGIWETRGGRQHFVLSKVMCWVALDRAIKAAKALDLEGEMEWWREVRAEIKTDVLAKGYDEERGAFVQSYGSKNLDASNLLLPLVGFIKADDPRMRSTIAAIERELTSPEGFVYRYRNFDDGLLGDEGTFLICTFWLADNLIKLGELDRAQALVDRCLGCANDLGLFSEELDARTGEMLGNFPQAFSHLGAINTAVQLARAAGGGTARRGAPK